jgi:RNA polymerase sigma factor for flagellar operon FliA
MSSTPEMTPDPAATVDEIWKQFILRKTAALRNQLLMAYLQNVRLMAARIHARLPAGVEIDDLVQAGTLGLMDAIELFDPGRGVKFETYSTPRIRGAILDELRSADWMPRPVRSRVKRLGEAVQKLEMQLGRTPTEQEVHDHLKLPKSEYRRTISDARTGSPVSLSLLLSDPNHDGASLENELLDDRRDNDPSFFAMREDLQRLLTQGLSRAERLIMIMYHYEGYTLREIGQVLDLSECRVCQIHTAVVQRLRRRMGRRVPELLMAG